MDEFKNPQEALEYLKTGNIRFAENRLEHPRRDPETRQRLTEGQNPFAALLTCADSRVSPDLVFDKGLGDLFVIRNAGNIVVPSVIASVEFAVTQLGVKLLVVMGHDKCGAVQATINGVNMGHLNTITDKIRPALVKAETLPGDLLDNTIRLNAHRMARQLRNAKPLIKPACDEGKLMVLPAVYSLESGQVEFYDPV